MIGRVVLVSLLALSACKKKDTTAGSDPTTGSSTTGASTGSSTNGSSTTSAKPTDTPPTETPPTTPPGEKRVNENGWTTQKGPGFTINGPGPATIEKVPANTVDEIRALERYTFHKGELESFVVEITELPEKEDLGMALNNMRMRITSTTQSVRGEDLIDSSETTGEVTGRDIWYVVDVGDDNLRARSKLLGKGHKLYEARAFAPRGEESEAKIDKFIESFVLTP